jgi:hypothetical protein
MGENKSAPLDKNRTIIMFSLTLCMTPFANTRRRDQWDTVRVVFLVFFIFLFFFCIFTGLTSDYL